MARKIGRPRADQAQLTRQRILAAALRLVDAEGATALSMRRLAAELGVDPMAIYHHLPGKQALLAGVVELVFGELAVETSSDAPWQDQVRAFARAYRALVRAHPHLTLYLVANLEAGGAAVLAANETLFSALASAGLAPPDVVQAADLVVDYLNGFALAEGLGQAPQGGLSRLLAKQPPGRFPEQERVLGSLPANSPPASVDGGLEIILAGIAARAEGKAEGRRQKAEG